MTTEVVLKIFFNVALCVGASLLLHWTLDGITVAIFFSISIIYQYVHSQGKLNASNT